MSGAGKGKRGGGPATVRTAIEQAHPAPGAGLVEPYGFEMRETGLWRLPTAEKKEFWVCGPFSVLAESRPAAQDDWGLLLSWLDRDGQPHQWIMGRRLLAGDAVAVREKFARCGLDVATHDTARRALVEYLAGVRIRARVRTVPSVGWYRPAKGGAVFVLPHRTIGTSSGEIVRLDVDPPPAIYGSVGTLDGWRDEVAARAIGNSRLLLGISCGFVGPLLPLMEDEGGGIHFLGGSSKGKTTIIDAAASVWGKPSKSGADTFCRSWRSTANALETVAQAHSNTLLSLDELSEADPGTLGETLYMLANGVGKARALSGGGARATATWTTFILSSGEESAAALVEQARRRFKAGQEVRLIDLAAEVPGGFGCFEVLHGEQDGSHFARALRGAVLARHGTAGPALVAWLVDTLARQPDFVAAELAPRVKAWCRAHVPPGADGQVQRAGRRFAMIAVAGELATQAAITGWPPGAAGAAAAVLFRDWLVGRGGTGSREDHHLFAALRRFVGLHGAARFAQVREPGDEDEGAQVEPPLKDGDRTMVRAGWRWQEVSETGERRWVHGMVPDIFDAEVARPLGMESRDARARLGKAGLIRGFAEGGEMRWTGKAKRIAGIGRPRLLVIEPTLLDGE